MDGIVLLDPIPPGLPKAEFVERLIGSIETASARLLVEARLKEPHLGQPVNL